jgi:hypothetical protein
MCASGVWTRLRDVVRTSRQEPVSDGLTQFRSQVGARRIKPETHLFSSHTQQSNQVGPRDTKTQNKTLGSPHQGNQERRNTIELSKRTSKQGIILNNGNEGVATTRTGASGSDHSCHILK